MLVSGQISSFVVEFAVSASDSQGRRRILAVQFTHPDGRIEAFSPSQMLAEMPVDPADMIQFQEKSLKVA